MAFGDPDPEQPAFPLAEVHLPQTGLHDRDDAQPRGQRRGRLDRATQGGDVDRRYRLGPEALRHLLRLLTSGRGQLGVALTVDERKRLAGRAGIDSPWRTSRMTGRPRRAHEAKLPDASGCNITLGRLPHPGRAARIAAG